MSAPAPASKGSEKPIYLRPAVLRLLIIALLGEIGYAVLNISTMPVYLKGAIYPKLGPIPNGRDMGETVVGLVLVAFLLSEAVFKSPMGSIADRIGHRKLMLIGPIFSVFTPILTLLVPHRFGTIEVVAILLLRVLDGIGSAMLWPAAFALMGSTVDDDERQKAMSLLNLCYMLGIALALPIGGAINDAFGYKWASLVFASLVFIAIVIAVWLGIPNEIKEVHHSDEHSSVGFGDFLKSAKQIPTFLILAAVTFGGIGFPTGIIKIFATEEFDLSEAKFGLLVFPAALAMGALSVPLSHVGEKIGKSRAVHLGMGLCSAGLSFICLGAVLPVFRETWVLAVAGIPLGLGFLLAIPAWMASVSDIDPKRRASNIGAVMTAQGLGAMIGVPIGATLYEKLQPYEIHTAHYSPFIGCAICVTIGWLLSLKLLKEPAPVA